MTSNIRSGYKVLNSDFTPPIQGGNPVWDGVRLPFTLSETQLDTGNAECASGWNYCERLSTAFRIAGLWRTGRPSVALHVEASPDAIQRGDKRRCSRLTIVARATSEEIATAIREMSEPFGSLADEMAQEQTAWFEALGRPLHDEQVVERGLILALRTRGPGWKPRRFDSAWAAWNARAAWAASASWDAWDAWNARAAWAAWDAWNARAAWAASASWDAWAAWNARAAWAASAAWDARAALAVHFAARQGWIQQPSGLLTTGLRDAYHHGLEIALPTGRDELGWAMVTV